MSALYVFNPEHDMALAVGRGPYTPPSKVMELKKFNQLLPAIYARNSSFILVDESFNEDELIKSPYYNLFDSKRLKTISINNLPHVAHLIKEVLPWGWNFNLVTSLSEKGLSCSIFPTENQLEKIKELSHRRTALHLRSLLNSALKTSAGRESKELFNINDVKEFLALYPDAFFKLPYSSSGRGIVAGDHISAKGLIEWAHGALRRQGSVIAEQRWPKTIDFASEWRLEKGSVYFKGFAVFKASQRGKYHGNFRAPQTTIIDFISSHIKADLFTIIEAQKEMLENVIAPYYSGPLGIDMLADEDGKVNVCVEINLRLTMGYIAANYLEETKNINGFIDL